MHGTEKTDQVCASHLADIAVRRFLVENPETGLIHMCHLAALKTR